MLQLPDHSPLLDLHTARESALAQVTATEAVRDLALSAAMGQVAARDVLALQAMPFFTNAAMDGYALRVTGRVAGPLRLPICGTVAAGEAAPTALDTDTARRIFTGAALPEGADAVVAIEDTREEAGVLLLDTLPKPGNHLRRVGSDQPAGACLLARGTRIAPHHVGLLAANGISRVTVTRQPRVAVLSTGDELAGARRGPGQIHDANRPMLLALAEAAGAVAIDAGTLPDDVEAVAQKLQDLSRNADLVLSSGGVSMGGRDPLRPAFLAAGGEIGAWRVAVKPGKPVMFGRIGRTAFTGLPGNPFAAFVGFQLFAAAQIAKLSGRTPAAFAAAQGLANFSWQRRPDRAEVFPVRCTGTDSSGLPRLERLGNGVSATLYPLAAADGLAIVPASTATVAPGDRLAWHPFCAG